MEAGQINCQNIGMTQDIDISKLGNEESVQAFAFENYNIRVTATHDNTKFVVTNEKSTKQEGYVYDDSSQSWLYEGHLKGLFIGGCTLNNYLVVFTKYLKGEQPDRIYRINYDATTNNVHIVLLYQGRLGFNIDYPIEAIGYYEAEEVQKVYWVDGLNQNRFINIVESRLADRPSGNFKYPWDDYSFDFQGRINVLPKVTITKNYNKAGFFQAGVMQYFITYYNRYGVETCLVYNSDLQYISLNDRGGKADESVSCGFDIEITDIDTEIQQSFREAARAGYDYLRIYASYRSGINGVVSTRILTDIYIRDKKYDSVIKFTDLGDAGVTFNSDDLFYVGGQDIRAHTLDYKQETLFLGDITIQNEIGDFDISRMETPVDELVDEDGSIVNLKEPCYYTYTGAATPTENPLLWWTYKYVSPITEKGVYGYDQQIKNSQLKVAGFKYREVYRFGIQFMSTTGEWTPAYWLGDKFCDLAPRYFSYTDTEIAALPKDDLHNSEITEYVDQYGNIVDSQTVGAVQRIVKIDYEQEGLYIANINLSIKKLQRALSTDWITYAKKFIAYRLLMVEPDLTNRRVVEQGVINPTMFNYYDRYYNQPFSIPSYLFRPRNGGLINRHYDTLPPQIEKNAELMGIISKKVPGYTPPSIDSTYNAYMFIIAVNAGSIWSGYEQWKLIYYNAGSTSQAKADKLRLSLFTNKAPGPTYDPQTNPNDIVPASSTECDDIAALMYKYYLVGSNDPDYADMELKIYNDTSPAHGIKVSSIVAQATQGQEVSAISSYLQGNGTPANRCIPINIYGTRYKIISSDWGPRNDKYKNKALWHGAWDDLRSILVDKITSDMMATTAAEVGVDLAGKIILSAAMLPDSSDIEEIGRAGSDVSEIVSWIAAGLIAAAAIVISALSFGTAAAPAAILATTAITSILATTALGCASLAASISLSDLSDVDKQLILKGYLSTGTGSGDSRLTNRQQRSKEIGHILERFFTPVTYMVNGAGGGAVQQNWNVPVLKGEVESNVDVIPTAHPFHTGRAYTVDTFIGMDYNAYCISGKLGDLSLEEKDVMNKQNLFCVDESILTLNSPTIEDTFYVTDNSEALNFDLVGIIPVKAVQGIYDMQVSNGLNSGSTVISGRYYTDNIEDSSSKLYGMVNGNIYQDFKPDTEAWFDSTQITEEHQVQESIGIYRILMWHRTKSAGFYYPNLLLTDGTGDYITSARSELVHKIFANLRYSQYTKYFKPFTMDIEKIVTCLDSEVVLKQIRYNKDTKTLYKNVDTISVNQEAYPLIIDDNNFPSTEEYINNGGIKDPISIRYRCTPFITIPLKWDFDNNRSWILPYTESPLYPSSLYDSEQLENVTLYGTNSAASVPVTYYFISTPDVAHSYHTDRWGKTGILTSADLSTLYSLTGEKVIISIQELTQGIIVTYYDNTTETFTDKSADDVLHHYLFQVEAGQNLNPDAPVYYVLSYTETVSSSVHTISWTSAKVTYLALNTKVYIGTEDTSTTPSTITYTPYYACKNIDSTVKTKVNLDVVDIMDALSLYQDGGTWGQDQINWNIGDTPFLFIGELTKKIFDYNSWNDGNTVDSMKNLKWIPISENIALETGYLSNSSLTRYNDLGDMEKELQRKVTVGGQTTIETYYAICNGSVRKTIGDTYYQRWDCEKTYPYTEEDGNSNVEILSFMLESHNNLDGRCDVNRGTSNLLNTRPTNTLFNTVYSQLNNFFTYNMDVDYLNKTRFEADIVWSLSKNNLDEIDKWVQLVATNEMSLDGRYGTIRKILNVNDVLITFQDSGIAAIKYNETAALNTTAGLPLQMGNTGKVDGYRMLSSFIGCHNKFSISKNSAGVFFCDDNTKTFNSFSSNEGVKDLGTQAEFSTWFKKNLNNELWTPRDRNNFRASYDEVNHDLYLIKNDTCLVYNTMIGKFISFMDYIDTPMIVRLNKFNSSATGAAGLFALRKQYENLTQYDITEIHQMFMSGDSGTTNQEYNYIYGQYSPYSIDYRVSPDPNHDSIFTNYQYTADWIDPSKEVDENNQFLGSAVRRFTTFDTIRAWNEYQNGEMSIETSRMGIHNIKAKFRIWRGNIPRDGSTIQNPVVLRGDRMRNPWVHIKFTKSDADNSKMIFHNLIITYYNQYGRF